MQVEYHKWFSQALNQDMELKVYGQAGKPVLVFPSQCGRFFDFEDRGMVNSVYEYINSGLFALYTVDSIDSQSWANFSLPPHERAVRHEDYDRYITGEVMPFIQSQHPNLKAITTGVSMGGYHAANFFFHHPQLFDGMISLSGLFSLRYFLGDYMDEMVYYNSPLDYLPNLNDETYLSAYRRSQIIICAGQGAWEEDMRREGTELVTILERKQVPAWLDLWGTDVNHDWPWWQKQLPYFFSKILPTVENQLKEAKVFIE